MNANNPEKMSLRQFSSSSELFEFIHTHVASNPKGSRLDTEQHKSYFMPDSRLPIGFFAGSVNGKEVRFVRQGAAGEYISSEAQQFFSDYYGLLELANTGDEAAQAALRQFWSVLIQEEE